MICCSEGVEEALSSVVSGLEEQIKMKEILVRLHKEKDGMELFEDEEESELVPGFTYSRAKAFACDEISIEDLTDAEINALQKSFQLPSSLDGNIIEPWTPWWESDEVQEIRISTRGGYMVEQIHSPNSTFNVEQGIPRPLEFQLTKFSNLSSKAPSDKLIFYLIDMLFWYCLELRISNGDYECTDEELMHMLFSCSRSFNQDKNQIVDSNTRGLTANIIETCCKEGRNINHNISRGIAIGILKDVSKILALGREGIILALSDLFHIATRVNSGYRVSKSREGADDKLNQKNFLLMEKKLLFFLSWANEYSGAIAPVFARELENAYVEFMLAKGQSDEVVIPH